MSTCRYAPLPTRAVLGVGGADRVAFLQGLVSNDVTKAAPNHGLWAALLTPQGKFLYDLMISVAGETLLLDVEAAGLEPLRKKMSMYKLRSQVVIDPVPEHSVFVAWGEGAAKAFGLDESPGSARELGGGTVMVDPRLAAGGLRLVLPNSQAEAEMAGAGFAQGDLSQWDDSRLRLGLPDGGRDLVAEQTLLLEAGFDELGGVDFKKGCYMGQELTARTKYRGLVKKRLLPVTFSGVAPASGDSISANGEEAGEFRSAGHGVGLALLRVDAVRAGTQLVCGETPLTPVIPGWVILPEPKA